MTDQVDHPGSGTALELDPLVLLALRTMPRLPFLCIKLHAGRGYDIARIARRLGISEARVVRNLKRAVLHTERVLHGRRRRRWLFDDRSHNRAGAGVDVDGQLRLGSRHRRG